MKDAYLIDTNLILRLLLGDIPSQLAKSKKLFKRIEEKKAVGLVSILVINELIWILEHFYKKKRAEFIPPILKLVSLPTIKILEIRKNGLILILKEMEKTTLDLTDLYLSFLTQKTKRKIASFDKKLLKAAVS